MSTVWGCDRDQLLLRAAHGWGTVDASRKRYVQSAYWHALCAPFRNQDKNHTATKWTNKLIKIENDTKKGSFPGSTLLCTRKRRTEKNTERCQSVFDFIFLRLHIGWGRVRDYFLGYTFLCVVTSLRFPVRGFSLHIRARSYFFTYSCVWLFFTHSWWWLFLYKFLCVITSLHIPVRVYLFRHDNTGVRKRWEGEGSRGEGVETEAKWVIRTLTSIRKAPHVKQCRWTNQTHTCLMPLSFSGASIINNSGANWW